MLSIIIPARCEKYLEKTILNVLENATGEIEIIAILDGYKPEIDIKDDRVVFIHNEESIGQRQSINQGVRACKGEYIMKLDAHCAVAKGFDEILVRDCEYDMTMIPRMYNLDVTKWTPKLHKKTDYMYISSLNAEKPFRASYYGRSQPKNDKEIDDTMCCMGPAFFMHKARFWELEGCDEGHGSWGQQGIEVACKAWLSGGRLVVNKRTWFAHWFRGGGVPVGEKSGFPYQMKQQQVEIARQHSQDLWLNNKWGKKVRDFEWMVNKFKPPTWNLTTALYYTDGSEGKVYEYCREDLKTKGIDVLATSNDGAERSHLSLYENILRIAEKATTKYVCLTEHDCLYPQEHFDFTPPRDDTFYYNTNIWYLNFNQEKFHKPNETRFALSGLVANRELLIEAVKKRIEDLKGGWVVPRA